jgi:hypothetical protein
MAEPDLQLIWEDLRKQIAALAAQLQAFAVQTQANFLKVMAALSVVIEDLNPPIVTSLQLWSKAKMAVVTTINLVGGGSLDEIVVQDQNGNNIAPALITWTPSTDPNVTVVADADASGFDFAAAAAVAAESLSFTATYNGPGNPGPVVGPALTVNVTAAPPPPPSVTALQYNEAKGS